MSEQIPIIIQAAELITTKPFELIQNYFKDKRERQKIFIQLLTDACFETQLEINSIKSQIIVPLERQREIAKMWSKVCAELMQVYPQIASQFHEKSVSWASVNTWKEYEISNAENNLKTIDQFIKKLAS